MHSTKNRIVITIVLCTLLATLVVGGFSLVYIRDESHEKTLLHLAESSKIHGEEMNTILTQVETVTETLTKSVQGIIDPSRIDNSYYFYELSDTIEEIAVQFDHNTFNIMSVYVRFDPFMSYSTSGFLDLTPMGMAYWKSKDPRTY